MKYSTNDKDFSIWLSKHIKPKVTEFAKQVIGGNCYICGTHCSSYCNSHSVPRFILDNLSKSGEYSNFAAVSGANFLKPIIGKNSAGTFHLICNDCDSKYFKEYEDKSIYSNLQRPLPPLFLSKINIKNLLYLIDKVNQELSHIRTYIEICEKETPEMVDFFKEMTAPFFFSGCEKLKKYEQLYQYTKYYADKHIETEKIILLQELPYTVPIAIQLAIPVGRGLSGETINDFKDIDKPFHMLNLCVFPLESKSMVLLSCHRTGKEFDRFASEINALSLDKKLEVINYMIFQFSEDFYCNTDVLAEASKNKELLKICQMQSECDLTLKKISKIPNLLSMSL